jgi:tol-pal system protein YbgF
MQARQDSLFNELARQNRLVMDSVRAVNQATLRLRGDLGHQILELGQQLVQVQELTGASHSRLNELRQEIESARRDLSTPPAPSLGTPGTGGVDVEQLYQAGVSQLEGKNAATARQAFERLLAQAPDHARAPDAQFNIGETFVLEGQYDRALAAFERVVELYPSSARAPLALFRAGVVSEDRGNNTKAREYFDRVVKRYPDSDEAKSAQDKLRRLRR